MAVFGLQIFDASGNVILDTSHHVLRLIGSVGVANGSASSLSDSRMNTGGWVAFQGDTYNGYNSGGVMIPRFTISAGVLSWSYPASATSHDIYCNGTAFYGAW